MMIVEEVVEVMIEVQVLMCLEDDEVEDDLLGSTAVYLMGYHTTIMR